MKGRGGKKLWCWVRAHHHLNLHLYYPYKTMGPSEGWQECVSVRLKGRYQNWKSYLWENVGPRLHHLKGLFFKNQKPKTQKHASPKVKSTLGQHNGDNLHVLGSRRHASWLSLRIWEILLEGGALHGNLWDKAPRYELGLGWEKDMATS